MAANTRDDQADHRHSRAVPVQARAEASRTAIRQAALALWRTKGFAATTVTDICKAAGVSKALFYVYFSRREDVLLSIEVFTMRDAHRAAESTAARPYTLTDLITAVIDTLVRQTRNYPPELVFETVLETYRLERRALAGGATESDLTFLFLPPFQRAARDGKLPAGTDLPRAARTAQSLVSDAIRTWAATDFRAPLDAEALARDIATLVGGTER